MPFLTLSFRIIASFPSATNDCKEENQVNVFTTSKGQRRSVWLLRVTVKKKFARRASHTRRERNLIVRRNEMFTGLCVRWVERCNFGKMQLAASFESR